MANYKNEYVFALEVKRYARMSCAAMENLSSVSIAPEMDVFALAASGCIKFD